MSKRVSSLLTLAALAAVVAPASAQSVSDQVHAVTRAVLEHAGAFRYQPAGEIQTERSTKTVKVGSNGVIDIANISGDITVSRGGGSEATIDIVKTARAATAAEAHDMLGQVQVDVADRAGRVEIRTQYPQQRNAWMGWGGHRGANVSVAFTVKAPAGVMVAAKSLSGNITVSDIKGELSLESMSGSIRVSNAGRISSAKSLSGNIEILDTRAEGSLEASAVSGNVVFRKVRARSIEAGSVSGTITADAVECDRVVLHSFSGGVEFTGPFVRGGRYEMKSHSGDLRITVTGGAGFEVDANSFSGSLRSDLALSNQASDRSEGRIRRRSLRGIFGDGSAVLELTTFSGNVVITKR
jgi:DUF4097 and DUF4098 domain-containing protein YvlB